MASVNNNNIVADNAASSDTPTAVPSNTVPSGKGYQGKGGGRKGAGRGGRGTGRDGNHSSTTRSIFKGNTVKMNGHVFQCYSEHGQKKQFAKTVEALGEYIAKELKHPGDLAPLTQDLTLPTVKEPDDLDVNETSRLKIALWEKLSLIHI